MLVVFGSTKVIKFYDLNSEIHKKRLEVPALNFSLSLLYQLNFTMNFYFISNNYLSGLSNSIPHQSKFFSADFSLNSKSCLGLAVGVNNYPTIFYIKDYRTCRTSDSKIAMQFVSISSPFVFFSFKYNLLIIRSIKKIS